MNRFSLAPIKKAYLDFSLYSSTLLWTLLFLSNRDSFWNQGLFVSLLLVGSYFFYIHGYQFLYDRQRKTFSRFYLFQTLCFIGMVFELNSIDPLYGACIPGMMSLISVVSQKDRVRSSLLFFLPISVLFILWPHMGIEGEGQSYIEPFFLISILFWVFGLSFWGMGDQKSSLKSYLRRQKSSAADSDYEERLFFHDLVNQTHGINLFLNYKGSIGEGLTQSECQALGQEVKVIQSLIKDYFNFDHKNLTNTYDYVSFNVIRPGIGKIIENFLPIHLIKVDLKFSGDLSNNASKEHVSRCYVHQAAFFRIMTNIVKNVAESGSKHVKIEFFYDVSGLEIKVKNMIFKLKEHERDLSQKLENLILDEDSRSFSKSSLDGLGLESISNITQKLGGQFNFGLEEGHWVTEIKLPNPRPELWKDEKTLPKNAA